MKDKAFGHWALGILVAAGVFIASLAAVELLFHPLSWLKSTSARASIGANLPAAREQWQSHGIEEYTIDVEGFVPLACLVNATLTVSEGRLVAVEERGIPGGANAGGVLIESEDWDTPFCSYRELVVPEMVARIERELDRIDWSQDRLEVQFDPEYGYVTEYRYECCYRQGIFDPTCTDCSIWFSFSNFEPGGEGF